MKQNRPPSDDMQSFGLCKIDAATAVMTHALHDVTGKALYKVALDPEG
jgi:alkaline phosphatase D